MAAASRVIRNIGMNHFGIASLMKSGIIASIKAPDDFGFAAAGAAVPGLAVAAAGCAVAIAGFTGAGLSRAAAASASLFFVSLTETTGS